MYPSLIFGALALMLAFAAVLVAFFQVGPTLPFILAFAVCVYMLFRLEYRRRGLVTLIALFALAPSFAFAAAIDIGQALTGSLQDIINGAVTAAIAGLVGWVAIVVKNKFNVDIEAQYRDTLTTFLQRQASSLIADGAVKLSGVKIEVQNEALAAAANTALAAIPGVLKFFDLTPEKIKAMIVDMLPKQPAIAQATAVAIDVANPATPSKAV